jgi:hypothetical protein
MNRAANELRVACLRALDKYFCEANRTCKLLIDMKKFPATSGERQAILEQRKMETTALRDYLAARARLLAAASCDGISALS